MALSFDELTAEVAVEGQLPEWKSRSTIRLDGSLTGWSWPLTDDHTFAENLGNGAVAK